MGTSKQQIMQEGFTPSSNGMLGPAGVYLASRDISKAAQYGPCQHGQNGCIFVVLVKCGSVHAWIAERSSLIFCVWFLGMRQKIMVGRRFSARHLRP